MGAADAPLGVVPADDEAADTGRTMSQENIELFRRLMKSVNVPEPEAVLVLLVAPTFRIENAESRHPAGLSPHLRALLKFC